MEKSELLKRFVTGTILAILAVSAIIFSPFSLFFIASTFLMLFAAWEWTVLMDLQKYQKTREGQGAFRSTI